MNATPHKALRKGALLAFGALVALLSGCSPIEPWVKPYERERLADPVMIPRVAALTLEQQGQVQELAVAELSRQKERLVAYTTQARFAVAQLYDRAALARNPDDASKP